MSSVDMQQVVFVENFQLERVEFFRIGTDSVIVVFDDKHDRQLTFDGTSGKVAAVWSYPEEGDGWSAVVFRRQSGTERFDQVSPRLTSNRYEDQLFDNGAYEYALRFYFSDQGGTPMGEAKSVAVTLPDSR